MNMGYNEVSARLDINKSSLSMWLKGVSRNTQKPLPLPRTVQLATMAIEAGLDNNLPEKFTSEDLREWSSRMGMTYDKGAEAFGVARSSYARWLSGVSSNPPRPIGALPRIVHLAAVALEAGLDAYLPDPFNPRSKANIAKLHREAVRAATKEVH